MYGRFTKKMIANEVLVYPKRYILSGVFVSLTTNLACHVGMGTSVSWALLDPQ